MMADVVAVEDRGRAAARKRVKKIEADFMAEIEREEPDQVKLATWVEKLDDYQQKLKRMDESQINSMTTANAVTDDQLEKELEEAEEYMDVIRSLLIIYNNKYPKEKPKDDDQQSTTAASIASTITASTMAVPKLPEKNLPKFDGKVVNYLQWKNSFEVIDGHPHLTDKQKFDYLMDAVADCKEAKACVAVFQMTGDNYSKAMQALKERFGNENAIGEALVMDILEIVNRSQKPSIVELYDVLQGKLQSLESMGRKLEHESLAFYPLVKRCLSKDLIVLWERYSEEYRAKNAEDKKSDLELLMDWLKREVRYKYAADMTEEKKLEPKLPTSAHLVSGIQHQQKRRCAFCGRGNHSTVTCFIAKKMSLTEKKIKLSRARVCFRCFQPDHQIGDCRSKVWCHGCKEKHHEVMCPEESKKPRRESRNNGGKGQKFEAGGSKKRKFEKTIVNDRVSSDNSKTEQDDQVPMKITKTISNNVNSFDMCMTEVPLQTLRVLLEAPNGLKKVVRAMIDSGSQRTTLLRRIANELEMVPIKKMMFQHKTYGDQSFVRSQNVFSVKVWNLTEEDGVKLNVLDDVKMVSGIPDVKRFVAKAKAKGVHLTDVNGAGEIELLIGNDVKGIIATGQKKTLDTGLTAFKTTLGWVLSGCCESENDIVQLSASLINHCSLTMLFDLETLGIKDPAETKSRKELDEESKAMFLKTLEIDNEGRYEIRLPAVVSLENLANNYTQAKIRLESMSEKLRDQGYFEAYQQVFDEWKEAGIIEEVPVSEFMKSEAYYMPHRAVVKASSSTTKVRPVFDASAKTSTKYSLNDCLAKGPNMLELIPALITKFRLRKVAATSDIAKAFLQISVSPEDRDYLRFLWYNENGHIKVYRHRRVVFGVNSSPFQLAAVIEFHLNNITDSRKHVAKDLLNHLYVDNCVISLDNEETYEEFKKTATGLLDEAKMDLRLWQTNIDSSCNQQEPTTTVLGMVWNKQEDTLQLKLNKTEVPTTVTKRVILSYANSVFDPMGLVAPVTLLPKLMLRQLESRKFKWDDEVPEEVKLKFIKWVDQLKFLKTVEVSRQMANVNPDVGDWQLHVFVDASKEAYAAAVYLRVQVGKEVTVRLLQAKARVAPKDISIPRAELMAAFIGSRLATSVLEAMEQDGVRIPITYWTDSKTALTWIKKEDIWGTFVQNRVEEIRKLTSVKDWRFVNGVHNPADLPSRGCTATKLWKSQWLDGPAWLYLSEDKWPKSADVECEEAFKERRKSTVSAVNVSGSEERPWYLPFNSLNKNTRVMAYILNWKSKSKSKGQGSRLLAIEDLEEAEKTICRLVQEESGVPDCESRLALQQDLKTKLWFVKTRTILSDNPKTLLKPIYLPKGHMIVDQIIRKVHLENTHSIGTVTINKIREKYWIKGLKKTVRTALWKCFGCRKFFAKKMDCPQAPLPSDRVMLARPFEVIGIDLGGHLLLDNGEKCWFVLFTDAVYRGIHLELVTSLSTEHFIMAFRRYISCRGRPKTVYSDNGTNFVGTNNLMQKLDWRRIEDFAVCERIRWKFNPPSAAWWGGWWERLVKIVKDLLKRNLGNATVNYDQLMTLLCDIEAVVNARPISYMSEDPEDLVAVTPEMFYQFPGTEGHKTVDLDLIESSMLCKEYQERQQLLEALKERFTNDYLSELLEYQKKVKGRELKVGDIVLVEDDSVKRQNWKIARVAELLTGRDGYCRAARLRMKIGGKMGMTVRPYQRLYPLEMELPSTPKEIEAEEEMVGASSKKPKVSGRTRRARRTKAKNATTSSRDTSAPVPVTTTRSGRPVRMPQRYMLDSLYECMIE